jgi:hypothetical protein
MQMYFKYYLKEKRKISTQKWKTKAFLVNSKQPNDNKMDDNREIIIWWSIFKNIVECLPVGLLLHD